MPVGKPMNNVFAAMFRDMVAMVRDKDVTVAHGSDLDGDDKDDLYKVCREVSISQTGDEAFAQPLYLYLVCVEMDEHDVWLNEILPEYEQ